MAGKYYERIILLNDMCTGLMASFAHLQATLHSPGGKLQCLHDADYAKIRKKLESSFPELPDVAGKGAQYDKFRTESSRITEELSHVYELFNTLVQFYEAAFFTLKDIPREIIEFKLSRNSSLIHSYMDLFTNSIRLILIFNEIDVRKMICSLYAAAYQNVNGTSENRYSKISQLIHDYQTPFRRFAEEFRETSATIGQIVSEFSETIKIAFNSDSLRQRHILNFLEEGDSMALPAAKPLSVQAPNLDIYRQLLYVEKYITWTCYAILICPTEMFDPKFLQMFQIAGGDIFVAPLFRDRVIDIHVKVDEMIKWFPPKNWNVQQPKNFKIKKEMKEISKDATINAGLKHKERRSYLRAELKNLVNIFKNIPGLLGPKAPVALAALSLARYEVNWHFRHIGRHPIKTRSKYFHEQEFQDPEISTLVALSYDLLDLIREHHRSISRYYIEYLKGAHTAALSPLLNELRDAFHSFSPAVVSNVNTIPDHIQGCDENNPDNANLEAFRLNWYRCISLFSTHRTNGFKIEYVPELAERMARVTMHSRFVDDLEGVLEEFAEMHDVWWFRDHFNSAFEFCVNDLGSLNLAENAIGFIKLAGSAALGCHPYCPQEIDEEGGTATRWADWALNCLATRVTDLIEPLSNELYILEDKYSDTQAATRLESAQKAKKLMRKGQNAQYRQDPYPGFESSAWSREAIQTQITFERALIHLVHSISSNEKIFVFDRYFRPNIFLEEHLREYFRDRLHAYFFHDNTMMLPTKVAMRIKTLQAAIQKCSNHSIYVNMDQVFRDVMHEEFTDPQISKPATAITTAASTLPSDQCKLIHDICSGYSTLIDKICLGELNIVYVPMQRAFLRIKKSTSRAVQMAEGLLNATELESLMSIIGIGGARTFDSFLMDLLSRRVQSIKTFLADNEAIISEFKHNFTTGRWEDVKNKMGGMNKFLQDLVGVGIIISLREIRHYALSRVQKNICPLLQNTMEDVISNVDILACNQFENVSSLARDLGIDEESDASFRRSLFAVAGSEGRLWTLLPHALAASFLDDYWRNVKFYPKLDALSGNEHTIALAVKKLLYAYSDTEANVNIVKDLVQGFLQSSSFVLLRMKMDEKSGKFRDVPLRAMVLVLEQFINAFPSLPRSALEKHMPYAIIHSSIIDISRNKQSASNHGQDSHRTFMSDGIVEEEEKA